MSAMIVASARHWGAAAAAAMLRIVISGVTTLVTAGTHTAVGFSVLVEKRVPSVKRDVPEIWMHARWHNMGA